MLGLNYGGVMRRKPKKELTREDVLLSMAMARLEAPKLLPPIEDMGTWPGFIQVPAAEKQDLPK